MTQLVRAFAAMFRNLPHRTTRNYKTLLRDVGTDIFNKEHRLEPYYVAAFAYYRLEFLFRNQLLHADLKPSRYHLLLAYRILVSDEALPPMNSHEMGRLCNVLMNHLWNDDDSRTVFETAAEHVRVQLLTISTATISGLNLLQRHYSSVYGACRFISRLSLDLTSALSPTVLTQPWVPVGWSWIRLDSRGRS
jgi:hypothetical protein